MDNMLPAIGKLVMSYHSGNKPLWSKQKGLIVDVEYNGLGQALWCVIFADGMVTWGGNIALEVIGWPE